MTTEEQLRHMCHAYTRLEAERDEARQLCGILFRWLEEALLVNNPALFYDRYSWLQDWVDDPYCGEGDRLPALPAPVPPAGEQHEHQHDPGGGEQQHTL